MAYGLEIPELMEKEIIVDAGQLVKNLLLALNSNKKSLDSFVSLLSQ